MNNTKPISYKKAALYYMLGTLFNKGVSFLTIPIFTRLLSTDDYGLVNTYNAWVSILTIVLSYALYMAIRSAFIDYKDEINDFVSVSITFTLLSSLTIGILSYIFTLFIHIENATLLVMLCVFQSLFAGLIEDYSMYLQMKYKYRLRTLLMILPNLLSIVVSIICIKNLKIANLYLGRIIPTAIITITFGLFVTLLIYKKSHVLFNKQYIKYGLSISLPLVFHGVALSVLSTSDRMMITWLADLSQTGIYSLIYNFGMAATVITIGFQGIWDPWLLKKINNKEYSDVNQRAKQYCAIITTALIAIIMIGPEVVHLLAKEEYWAGISIIPPIVIANYVIFLYTFYVNVEHYSKKTLHITIHTSVAAVSNLLLNFIFIPIFGYSAAAYTTVSSYVICLILHIHYSHKLIPDLFPFKMFIIPLCEITVLSVAYYIFIDNPVIRWVLALVFTIIVIYRNRSLVKQLILSHK